VADDIVDVGGISEPPPPVGAPPPGHRPWTVPQVGVSTSAPARSSGSGRRS